MVNEKDPAMMPGEGARAIDTFRFDYSANGSIEQAEKALRNENFGNGFNDFGYFDEMACMMAYLAGYAPGMPVKTAYEMITRIVKERRQMA